ncbi:MAG: hypothetical protein R6V03_03400 [Kiritimatiellia bacterium]
MPASNLRDCVPFKSEHAAGLGEDEAGRCDALLKRGEAALASNAYARAGALLGEAHALDRRHARLLFRLAQAKDGLGRHEAARALYCRARDEDVCPLRAPRAIVETVREVATGRDMPAESYPIYWASVAKRCYGERIGG